MNDNEPSRTKGSTETYRHGEGRSNWTQVEHMRTGADDHKGGKQDNDRKGTKEEEEGEREKLELRVKEGRDPDAASTGDMQNTMEVIDLHSLVDDAQTQMNMISWMIAVPRRCSCHLFHYHLSRGSVMGSIHQATNLPFKMAGTHWHLSGLSPFLCSDLETEKKE
ncbi:unnamed protein product [Pleuronectes platessa]|uniref:Uncharacterized protein n=1 Tax=Pleuronectes platessa TaxID=8262 RepID=A0A9N7TXF1_PLEPL|nr:unnamed protein product [Pleuronectes platessa]